MALAKRVRAMTPVAANSAGPSVPPSQGLLLWAGLFLLSATLHSAESAITKLSTWKIKEFAEEEGPDR
jgi:hypothetical protein